MPRQNVLQVVVPAARYYSEPGNFASLETEALFGEKLTLLDEEGEYYKVQTDLYATPGFVHRKDVDTRYLTPTHRVKVPYANVYHGPSFKSGVALELCLNALLTVSGGAPSPEGGMLHIEGLGWIREHQVGRLNEFREDFVQVALESVGPNPYIWGGRFHSDCSALVMDAHLACGGSCPRNVSEQVREVGEPVSFDQSFSNLRRGDHVFWTDPRTKGRHVVIMTNSTDCVHTTIKWDRCIEQPLIKAIEDQEEEGNGRPTAVRRLPNYRFWQHPAA